MNSFFTFVSIFACAINCDFSVLAADEKPARAESPSDFVIHEQDDEYRHEDNAKNGQLIRRRENGTAVLFDSCRHVFY